MEKRPKVGIGVMVIKEGNILLGKRKMPMEKAPGLIPEAI